MQSRAVKLSPLTSIQNTFLEITNDLNEEIEKKNIGVKQTKLE